MSYQSEALLEKALIQQMIGLGYESIHMHDSEGLVDNLKAQLERFNATTFTDKEFATILNHLAKGNVFEKAKTLRDRFYLLMENGETKYVRFFDTEHPEKNHYQVSNQISQSGSFLNRYDITILVNGLPLVQIELKRRGLEIKEAFNQVNRYQNHTFWSNHGLFQYVQLFVISNGVNTKYFANDKGKSVKQTFYWSDENNRLITELPKFAEAFLKPLQLGYFISHYVVMNEAYKVMMVLRPYQFYAAEAIVRHIKTGTENGYIWHTTGSGKTLTSFKASQIVMELPEVHKVVFVVDRKDLDYQTMKEFNSFKDGSVDGTEDTSQLVRQLTDDTKLIVTTIQKLNNAISKAHYDKKVGAIQQKKMVFIFDECHRSQFGDTHDKIKKYFQNSQMIGFTGTPIFAENASKNEFGKRTTKDLFGACLHKYVITDAIRDENVLKFGIEYVGRYRSKSRTLLDIEVEAIDKAEVLNSEARLNKIADYIIAYHDQKTFNKTYSAMFAVSSIENALLYYDLFQKKKEAGEHQLRIATIFTFGANEDDPDAQDILPAEESYSMAAEPATAYVSTHTRDKLESCIQDYNKMFGQSFTTKDSQSFANYFQNISKRLKDRERDAFDYEKDGLDLVIVVNMMLTGFDAKKVNTLYVDKNLKYHGLIQAFSRTNRILGEQKSQGNILCFRNLKKSTDEAITLFSNKDAIEVIVMPEYEDVAKKFDAALKDLYIVVPEPDAVNQLESEEEELQFVQAFRELMRIKNQLQTYTDFEWEDLGITEQQFEDFKSKYLDLKDAVRQKTKTSILEDVDFELELIHRDTIDRSYILKLLAKLKEAKATEKDTQKKAIIDMMSADVQLRSKRELIEQFIDEHLPKINDADAIQDEFEQFWQDEKIKALDKLCQEEQLDKEQFNGLIEAYIFSGQDPVRDEVIKCLGNRPSVLQAKSIGERIIARMKEFVEVFVRGMVG